MTSFYTPEEFWSVVFMSDYVAAVDKVVITPLPLAARCAGTAPGTESVPVQNLVPHSPLVQDYGKLN